MQVAAVGSTALARQTAGDRMSHQGPRDWLEFEPWVKVIQRIICVSRSGGYSIVTTRIVVDDQGRPVCWLEPTVARLEPKGDPGIIAKLLGG